MLPRTYSKAYLEGLFQPPPQVSGAIGSRPTTMHRTASVKSVVGGMATSTDNYKPARSSILAAQEPVSDQDEEGETRTSNNSDEDIRADRSVFDYTPNKALSISSSTSDEADDASRFLRISTSQQASRRSSIDATLSIQIAQNVQAVLAVLDREDLDDEDRIEQVRTLLACKIKEIEGQEVPAARLDNIVLSLLHRHREDVRPTGATFPTATSPSPSPFPASPRSRPRPANLRTGSSTTIMRPWTPTRPSTPTSASFLSNDNAFTPSTSPIPSLTSSRNGPSITNMLGSPRASPSLRHRTLANVNGVASPGSSITSRPGHTVSDSRPSSPGPGGPSMTGSPSLNVAAVEFKPRAGGSGVATPSFGVKSNVSVELGQIGDGKRAGSNATDDSDEDEFSPFAVQTTRAVPVPSSSSSSSSSSQLTAQRNRPTSGISGNSSMMSMTTADSVSGSYQGSTTSASLESSDDPRSLRFTGVEDDLDNLTMTPFDVLTSILAGMGSASDVSLWSPEQIEELLESHGWDVDATMAAIIEGNNDAAKSSPDTIARAVPTGPAATRSGVSVVPHDVFASQRAGVSGSPGPVDLSTRTSSSRSSSSNVVSQHSLQHHQAQVSSLHDPQAFPSQPLGRAGPGRVCRFFLAGECRRADCRFSHDVNRALCRFWLKGQCLNGQDCSFMHDLSIADSTAVVRASSAETRSPVLAPIELESGPSEDFPELVSAPTGPKALQLRTRNNVLVAPPPPPSSSDTSRARWSQTLQRKWNSPIAQIQQGEAHVALHSKHGPTMHGVPTGPKATTMSTTPPKQQRTSSSRIPLRASLLLPSLNTGKSASQAYATYREQCLALSEKRNKSLARAAEAWKAGNGAEARKWSQEGQSLNQTLQEESKALARSMVRSRHDEIRSRIAGGESGQSGVLDASIDERGARGLRGKRMGADLGICLGVVPARSPTAPSHLGTLSMDERTEVLFDCHLLHANEAVELVEEFLMGLEREQFRGLAYLAVGLNKHTSVESDRRRVAIAPAIKSFLASWNYPFADHDGVLVVDPLTHT